MKKLIFSMLAMAAMVSCSNEGDPINEVNPPVDGEKVEIKLNAGVVGVETKAAIAADPSMGDFDNSIVSLLRQDAENTTGMTWLVSAKEQATIASDGTVTLPETYKFYDKAGKNAYFLGYYPDATITSGVVAYTGINGTKDILCTSIVDAGSGVAAKATALEFKHMLSQVEIQVVGEAVAATNFGKIKTVTLKDVPSAANLTIGESPALVQIDTDKGDIILFDEVEANWSSIPTTAAPIGSIPMLVPGLGGSDISKLVIEIVAEKKTSTVNITSITGGLVSGQKHVITLTFKSEITATASIVGWGTGSTGTGDVE